jgi:hypothetical protein
VAWVSAATASRRALGLSPSPQAHRRVARSRDRESCSLCSEDSQQQTKIRQALEYVDGWRDGYEHMSQIRGYLTSLHVRRKFREALFELSGGTNAELVNAIVDKFWPRKKFE